MNCATCGHDMPEGTLVCGNCGATNVAQRPESPPSGAADAGASTPPPVPAYASASTAPGANPLIGRLVDRVKAILLTPKTEWPVIAEEPATRSDIYLRYVAPLVAIGVIASFIGATIVGVPIPTLGTVRVGLGIGLAAAILHFLLSFVVVFVVALIVDALAPTFGGQKDALRALKVTAYSFTPAWVAAILRILPTLHIVAALIGLYGLYLMYVGLPVLMRTPADKALGYTVVVVLCAIVLSIIISALTTLAIGGYGIPGA
jgi:Yip1 domain.